MIGVQPVTDEAYEAMVALGNQGGWEGLVVKPKKTRVKAEPKTENVKEGKGEDSVAEKKVKKASLKKETSVKKDPSVTGEAEVKKEETQAEEANTTPKKRGAKKVEATKEEPIEGTRRSKRVKVEQ